MRYRCGIREGNEFKLRLVAVRNHLRLGFATAALPPQRGCSLQPSPESISGWITNENENNSKVVVSLRGTKKMEGHRHFKTPAWNERLI